MFMFPIWAIPLMSAGINAGLFGLRKVVPKLPAWLAPFVNLGLGLGFSFLGAHGVSVPDPSQLIVPALAISGTAALTHNVVKNLVRGDDLATPPKQI